MKKLAIITAATLVVLYSTVVPAAQGGFYDPSATSSETVIRSNDGFRGPSENITSPQVITKVSDIKEMRDDSRITVQGKIVKHLRGDNYLFQDSSGSIEVDIGNRKWRGITITPDDLVEIRGKVDKDYDSLEIDVKHIKKIASQ